MTEENKGRSIIPRKTDPGFVKNLIRQLQLILRLMGDKRVPFLLKLFPVGSLVYLIAPDLIPFVVDDALILGLGSYIFIELCPPDVVEEHRRAIWGESGQIQEAPPEDVVEAEFSDQKENKKE